MSTLKGRLCLVNFDEGCSRLDCSSGILGPARGGLASVLDTGSCSGSCCVLKKKNSFLLIKERQLPEQLPEKKLLAFAVWRHIGAACWPQAGSEQKRSGDGDLKVTARDLWVSARAKCFWLKRWWRNKEIAAIC